MLLDPSNRNPDHVQGYILVTHHFMQAQWICYSTQKLVMYHLNYMWCFTTSYPQFRLQVKSQYPPIVQILLKSSHKVVHQIILTSKIHGLLQIFKKIPEKLQYMNRSSSILQRIKITRQNHLHLKRIYMKVLTEREHAPLVHTNF